MPEERAAKLKEAYVFLRNVEHALQYVDDQQTQFLPRTGETAERAARLLGVTLEDLWTQVEAVRGFVAQAFEGVFLLKDEKAESAGDDWPVGWQTGTRTAREALAAKLRSLGYGEDLDEVIERVTALRHGRRGAMGEEARSRMTKLLPFVMEKAPGWCGAGAGRVIAPEEALGRYLKLLEAVSGRFDLRRDAPPIPAGGGARRPHSGGELLEHRLRRAPPDHPRRTGRRPHPRDERRLARRPLGLARGTARRPGAGRRRRRAPDERAEGRAPRGALPSARRGPRRALHRDAACGPTRRWPTR